MSKIRESVAAYVFERNKNGANLGGEVKLTASDGVLLDRFGVQWGSALTGGKGANLYLRYATPTPAGSYSYSLLGTETRYA